MDKFRKELKRRIHPDKNPDCRDNAEKAIKYLNDLTDIYYLKHQ